MITISINPVAFTIGALSIRWYGIMVALGILVLVLWLLWQVRKGANLTYDTIFTVSLIGIPSGIVVSRLVHVIDNLHFYLQNPGQIFGPGGLAGLTIWGAVLGATLGIWIYSKFSNFNFAYFVDLAAPGIILAQVLGRVGCTLNGCCYGLETDLFCGVVYTHMDSFAPIGIPVHPTQIYEIIYLLIIFAGLLKLRGRIRPEGSLFLVYLSLYSLWRLGIGFLREGTPFLLGLQESQIIGIIVLAIAIPILAVRTRRVGRINSAD
ncbi:prolipoprotein diacylglyceryl transferase [Chloroflexota bacterium]